MKHFIVLLVLYSFIACTPRLTCTLKQFEPINGVGISDFQDLELVYTNDSLSYIFSVDNQFGINIYDDTLNLLHYYNVVELNKIDHAYFTDNDSTKVLFISGLDTATNVISLFTWDEQNSDFSALLQFNQNDFSPAVSHEIYYSSDTLKLLIGSKDSSLTQWSVFPETYQFEFVHSQKRNKPLFDFDISHPDTIISADSYIVSRTIRNYTDSASTTEIQNVYLIKNGKLFVKTQGKNPFKRVLLNERMNSFKKLWIADAEIYQNRMYILGSFVQKKKDPLQAGILVLELGTEDKK